MAKHSIPEPRVTRELIGSFTQFGDAYAACPSCDQKILLRNAGHYTLPDTLADLVSRHIRAEHPGANDDVTVHGIWPK